MPPFLLALVNQLRRRGLPIGVDDCLALRRALGAGFGWSSRTALVELCVALWATSTSEADVVRAAFERVDAPVWAVDSRTTGEPDAPLSHNPPDSPRPGEDPHPALPDVQAPLSPPPPPATRRLSSRSYPPPSTGRHDPTLVVVPQYPVTERMVAQIWRGLRRPTRIGPPVELDVAATLRQYALVGVPTPPVLVPRRRNTARLLLLVDRQGSMAPFHDYVEYVQRAMRRAGLLNVLTVAYFHNDAGSSPDRLLLDALPDPFSPDLDPILARISPLSGGRVYADPGLTVPVALDELLTDTGRTTGAVIVSDAGAARGALDTARVLDVLAFGKALRTSTDAVVWLNPTPPSRWDRTSAEQIARHVPMFALTRDGLYQAVEVLRGRPASVERPL